jgi:hypothetical protein
VRLTSAFKTFSKTTESKFAPIGAKMDSAADHRTVWKLITSFGLHGIPLVMDGLDEPKKPKL